MTYYIIAKNRLVVDSISNIYSHHYRQFSIQLAIYNLHYISSIVKYICIVPFS